MSKVIYLALWILLCILDHIWQVSAAMAESFDAVDFQCAHNQVLTLYNSSDTHIIMHCSPPVICERSKVSLAATDAGTRPSILFRHASKPLGHADRNFSMSLVQSSCRMDGMVLTSSAKTCSVTRMLCRVLATCCQTIPQPDGDEVCTELNLFDRPEHPATPPSSHKVSARCYIALIFS